MENDGVFGVEVLDVVRVQNADENGKIQQVLEEDDVGQQLPDEGDVGQQNSQPTGISNLQASSPIFVWSQHATTRRVNI